MGLLRRVGKQGLVKCLFQLEFELKVLADGEHVSLAKFMFDAGKIQVGDITGVKLLAFAVFEDVFTHRIKQVFAILHLRKGGVVTKDREYHLPVPIKFCDCLNVVVARRLSLAG